MLRKVSDKTAYILVIAMCFVLIIGYTGFDNASGSLYSFFYENLHVESSLYHSVIALVGVLTSAWIKTIVKHLSEINVRLWMIIGNIVGLVSGLLLANATNIVLYIILLILRKCIMFAFSSVMVTVIIVNWFKDKTATITAAIWIASGLGGIIMSKIYSLTIPAYGYLFSACLNKVIVFLLMVPCMFLLPVRPQDVGKKPYEEINKKEKAADLNYNLDYRSGSRIFMAIVVACACVILMANIYTFLPSLFAQKGFDSEQCSLTTTYCMIGNIASKLIFCLFVGKVGVRRMCTIMLSISAIGLGCIIFVKDPSINMMHCFLIMYGASHSVSAIGISQFVKVIYAVDYFAQAYSLVVFYDVIASNIVSIGTSFIFDKLATYTLSFEIALLMGVLAILLMNIIMLRLKNDAPIGLIK